MIFNRCYYKISIACVASIWYLKGIEETFKANSLYFFLAGEQRLLKRNDSQFVHFYSIAG